MSQIGNIAKRAASTLLDGGQTSRLTFRKFDGTALATAAEKGTDVPNSAITTVVLNINPEEIRYSEPKITQKIQTAAPGRFIVFDWGTDLLSMTIAGNTGNLLPGIIQDGFNPIKGITDQIAEKIKPGSTSGVSEVFGAITPYAQNIMMKGMTYNELLELSPKYRTFTRLRQMYQTFDADYDVLTLEAGDVVYRGYFMDFEFTQNANTPWNWKYTINFISLTNLSDSIRRGDDTFNTTVVEQE